MIKATDLRIGNFIRFPDAEPKDGWCINSIDDEGIGTDGGYAYFGSEIEGIPLTEQWFEKFGFRKNIAYFKVIRKFNTLELAINNDTSEIQYYVYFREINDKDFVMLRKDLKFVHELQNLYFALTNQELIPLVEGECPDSNRLDKGEEK